QPPKSGFHSKNREKIRRHQPARCPMRLTAAENAERPVTKLDELVDGLGLRPIVRHFDKGKVRVLDSGGSCGLTQMHQSIGVGIRQRSEKDTVNDAEDRSVRADPQSERHNECHHIARCFPETPYCKSYLHHVNPSGHAWQVPFHPAKLAIDCIYGL